MAYIYPPAQVADRYLVTYVGTLCGQRIMNTFQYGLASKVGNPTQLQIMDAMNVELSAAGELQDKFLLVTPDNYVLNGVWIQPIYPNRWVKKVYTRALSGGGPASAVTANMALTITRRGVRATRLGVGSLHIPIGSTESYAIDGKLSNEISLAANDVAAKVSADIETANGDILHPIVIHDATTSGFEPIGFAFVQDTVRVMRRRTVRVGE